MISTPWALHSQLAADTHRVMSLPLSDVLLMDDANYPWLILVPRIAGAVEWIDLLPADQHRLLDEVAVASNALRRLYAPDKLNMAALGNVVAQLHVHVVARFAGDAAWPKPVWGAVPARRYDAGKLAELMNLLASSISQQITHPEHVISPART